MRLIGSLNSPYVRRVAVSLNTLGMPYTQDALRVFQTPDAPRQETKAVGRAELLARLEKELVADADAQQPRTLGESRTEGFLQGAPQALPGRTEGPDPGKQQATRRRDDFGVVGHQGGGPDVM